MRKRRLFLLLAVCAVVFGISAFQVINYYVKDRLAEQDFAELLPAEITSEFGESDSEDPGEYIPSDGDWVTYEYMLTHYERLREQNPDMAGWLSIPGTRVSYPVMQTPGNPEYYLDKNFQKKISAAGSLFASAISDVESPSDVVTIFGHRMRTGAMFGSLGDYLNLEYMEEFDTIILDTFKGRNKYKVYAVFSLDVSTGTEFAYYDYGRFRNEGDFNEFVRQVRNLAQVENPAYAPVYGDKFLLLSTCEYTHEDGRLVLVAVSE